MTWKRLGLLCLLASSAWAQIKTVPQGTQYGNDGQELTMYITPENHGGTTTCEWTPPNFTGQDPLKPKLGDAATGVPLTERPADWQYEFAQDPSGVDSKCGIRLTKANRKDSGTWSVRTDKNDINGAILIKLDLNVLPLSIDIMQGGRTIVTNDVFDVGKEAGIAYNGTGYSTTIACIARATRPNVTFTWEIDEGGVLDINSNITTSDLGDGAPFDITSTFLYTPNPSQHNQALHCRVTHPVFGEYDNNTRFVRMTNIPGPPALDPSEIHVEFPSGAKVTVGKDVTVEVVFSCNPNPNNTQWTMPDGTVVMLELDNSVVNNTRASSGVSGRYSVSIDYDQVRSKFKASLTMKKMTKKDTTDSFMLEVRNIFGTSNYTLRVQDHTKLAKSLNGGEIAGIVIGCIALVVIIVVVAFFVYKKQQAKKKKKQRRKQRDADRKKQEQQQEEGIENHGAEVDLRH